MKEVILKDGHNNICSISNICYNGKVNAFELKHWLLKTNSANEFVRVARKLTQLEWSIFDDDDNKVVLVHTDYCKNKDYLVGTKSI